MICVNNEHPKNNLCEIFLIFPTISRDLIPSKIWSPNEVTEEGIDIFVNDMQFSNAFDSIDLTDDGIKISINDVQFSNAFDPID